MDKISVTKPVFDRLRVFFLPTPAPIISTVGFQPFLKIFDKTPPSLLEKMILFLFACVIVCLLISVETTKKIGFRSFSFSSKPEPDLETGSGKKCPGSGRLWNTGHTVRVICSGELLCYRYRYVVGPVKPGQEELLFNNASEPQKPSGMQVPVALQCFIF